MTAPFVDLDARPILRAGGEPFQQIMEAVAALAPGQGLRLFSTFMPAPLFSVLGSRGFSYEAIELADGDWEVLFWPKQAASGPEPASATPASELAGWPDPVHELDHRDLDPPEPLVRILAATEAMEDGEVLAALLDREPTFLFPELTQRGHAWRGGFETDGTTYKILVRIGAGKKAAA